MSHPPLEDSADVRESLHASAWARWRPLLMRLHFYAGVFVAPFILVAAVTGVLYALVPQLDQAVSHHQLTVDHVGERRLPLADQLAAARAAHPEGTVTSIRPPAAPNETTQVALKVDDVAPDYGRTVFVDPYTGEVRGALTTFGQWMPLRAWFDELHRNLHLGAVGRNYSELAASWLWVIAGSGLLLWIGHRVGTGRLTRLFVPDAGVRGRRRLLSWHGSLGVWIIAALLLLSVSGMTWSRFAGAHVSDIRSHLTWSTPAVDTTLPSGAAADAQPLDEAVALRGADTALRAAQDAGLQSPIWMYPPSAAGQGWQVAENKRDWPTRYDAVSVDPDSGAITARVDFADWPFMAKVADWIVGAHMGILFGVVNQIVLAAVGVALIAVVLLGYRMWWRRRPTRTAGFVIARGPRRGVLSELRPYEAVLAVVALAAFGYFAPLFGVSLAVFVAVDVALGWWQSARREAGAR
ncbi:peptidase [Mycolicibacterium madagascariense]|uniref:Peptidase n=1 Tax=Mycolicibacterium madagascariense TaxID=212765 RepID=A0A7I7XDS4_9MYCO|nr:PepSY-associated TM helix domain-containing protein [Mycolicibacterium madagascariense]BBZ26891.1 peptidase [Mycolicibacterium madagascariense]